MCDVGVNGFPLTQQCKFLPVLHHTPMRAQGKVVMKSRLMDSSDVNIQWATL